MVWFVSSFSAIMSPDHCGTRPAAPGWIQPRSRKLSGLFARNMPRGRHRARCRI